jgi:Flp pilus assembly protein TadG
MRRRTHPDDKGIAALEFVIIAPLFFMLLFGICSFGVAWSAKVQVSGAANDAARAAALHQPYTPPSGVTISPAISATSCPTGSTTTFNITTTKATPNLKIPTFGLLPGTVTQTVKVQCVG